MKWFAAMFFLLSAPAWARDDKLPLPPVGCKKVCTARTQPCGNTCIPKKEVCRKRPGTACAGK